jgi:fibronectin-binding autotransporter adhesin
MINRSSHRFLSRASLMVAAALLGTAPSAQAATLSWDGADLVTGDAQGGAGTWDASTTANWWDGTSNIVWPAPGGTDDDAVFGGTAGTVTIAAGGITANDLTFNSTG